MANPPRRKDDHDSKVSIAPAKPGGSPSLRPPGRPSMAPSPGSIPSAAPVDDLAEVERALSLMQGRDPKYERALRETREAAERRARELEEQAARDKRRALVRSAVGVAIVIVLGGIGAFSLSRRNTTRAIDRALAPLADPFLSIGFAAVHRKFGALPTSAEYDSEGSECFVVVSNGGYHVERGGVGSEGTGTHAFCTCGPELVSVRATGAGTTGVRLLHGDGHRIGGIRALPFMPKQPDTVGAGGTECAEDQFDGWLEGGKTTPETKAPEWLSTRAPGLPRGANGFHVVAKAAAHLPAAIVAGAASSCFVAIAENETAKLSLRWKGGERVIEGAPSRLGYCSKEAKTATILREGTGEVVVLAGNATSLGGVLGVEEIGARVFHGESPTWAPAADLEWSAQRTLMASGIPEGAVTTVAMDTFSRALPTTRVVALSVDGQLGAAAFDDDRFFCTPPFDAKARGVTCTEPTHEFFVRIAKVNKGGLAQGTLPLWMETVASAPKSPTAAAIEGKLLSLVRQLTSEGFVSTFLEAATEHEFGIEVFGRKGEDAVVVVGLANRAPFVFPYTSNSTWTLDDPPKVIPLEEGHVVSLATKPPPTAAVSERRTVVFRRKVER